MSWCVKENVHKVRLKVKKHEQIKGSLSELISVWWRWVLHNPNGHVWISILCILNIIFASQSKRSCNLFSLGYEFCALFFNFLQLPLNLVHVQIKILSWSLVTAWRKIIVEEALCEILLIEKGLCFEKRLCVEFS